MVPMLERRRNRSTTVSTEHRDHVPFSTRRLAVSFGVCAVVLAGGALVASSAGTPNKSSSVARTPLASTPLVRTRSSSTVELVSRLEAASRTQPNNPATFVALGSAYIRRAYETADPAFYPLAASALDAARRLTSNSSEVLAASASLALAQHRFASALTLADSALKVRPGFLSARIARVDALVELGRYDEAAQGLDAITEQHAGISSYSRLSYLRQLRGDLPGAILAMRQAVSAAPDASVDRAVTSAYLGDVLLESGRIDAAKHAYDVSLGISPGLPLAVMGRARVDAALGNVAEANRRLDELTQRVPLPGALGLRADLARLTGNRTEIDNADQLVDASIALFRANGAVVDAELAVLLADRGPTDPKETVTAGTAASTGAAASTATTGSTQALDAAQRAYTERHTIFTNDAMAWALHRSGRTTEALPYSRRAIASSPEPWS